MQLLIKNFDVHMEVKNKPIEFEVRSPDGKKHWGDLVLKKNSITWCKGRTKCENGFKLTWEKFMKLMDSECSK